MSLNESIVEDAALEWLLLRHLLLQGYEGQKGYGGQVGELGYSCLGAEALIPAFSRREKEKRETIRRLNPFFPFGYPCCASVASAGAGEEARATGKRYLQVRIERTTP